MKEHQFLAEIVRGDAVPAEVVRERAYGAVRVTAEWPEELAPAELRVRLRVRGELADRDAPAYAELFFHDAFLLMNLAAPGSFEGTITIAGGALRARTLLFQAGGFAAVRERVPLARVTAWYDALAIGTRQMASNPIEAALFTLLRLARREEDESESIAGLAPVVESLLGRAGFERLFELRDAIAGGRAPRFHPMHDDALDPRVEDATAEWIALAGAASSAVVRALQSRIV
jgi:hypothetical protein